MQAVGVLNPVALQQAFRAFDINKTGRVNAKEWLVGMAVMRRGTVTQRLKLVFQARSSNVLSNPPLPRRVT